MEQGDQERRRLLAGRQAGMGALAEQPEVPGSRGRPGSGWIQGTSGLCPATAARAAPSAQRWPETAPKSLTGR